MVTDPLGDVLTIEELARYLKVPKSSLYKLAQEGKVPAQKVGRHWRFRREAIDRWLEEGGAPRPEPEGKA
ncbi:MAG: helix-turn-helix domain-containing protein [Deferrisomatales bacterium]